MQDTRASAEANSPLSGFGVTVALGALAELRGNAPVENGTAGFQIVQGGSLRSESDLVEATRPPEGSDQYGWGVNVAGADAVLASDAILGNHDVGVFGASFGGRRASLTVTGSLVADTQSRPMDGQGGIGILGLDSDVDLAASVLQRNRVAGAMADVDTHLAVRQCRIRDVIGGRIVSESDGSLIDNIGDGLVALKYSTIDVVNTEISGATRVGVLAVSTSGSLTGVRASDNQFGLVLEGMNQLNIATDCDFSGNSEEDVVEGRDLPIPDSRPPLP